MARQYRSLQARALLVLLALSATTACAGEVGKYRDAAIAPIPGEAGVTATGADAGAATASPIGAASDTAVPTTVAAGTPASPGTPAVTPTSGPAARLSGQSALPGSSARSPLIVANIDEQVALPLKTVFAVSAYWQYHEDERLRRGLLSPADLRPWQPIRPAPRWRDRLLHQRQMDNAATRLAGHVLIRDQVLLSLEKAATPRATCAFHSAGVGSPYSSCQFHHWYGGVWG
jgi:hypothetical protein